MQNEPVEVTLKVTTVFEQLSVSYRIGGSLASPEDTILAKWVRLWIAILRISQTASIGPPDGYTRSL